MQRNTAGALPGRQAAVFNFTNMERMTQKALKRLVNLGITKDVTNSSSRSDIPEGYSHIGYSCGVYGCNGMLFQGRSGQLYAVTARTSAIYIF